MTKWTVITSSSNIMVLRMNNHCCRSRLSAQQIKFVSPNFIQSRYFSIPTFSIFLHLSTDSLVIYMLFKNKYASPKFSFYIHDINSKTSKCNSRYVVTSFLIDIVMSWNSFFYYKAPINSQCILDVSSNDGSLVMSTGQKTGGFQVTKLLSDLNPFFRFLAFFCYCKMFTVQAVYWLI